MNKYIVFLIALIITVLLWLLVSAGYLPLDATAFIGGGTASLCYLINQLK